VAGLPGVSKGWGDFTECDLRVMKEWEGKESSEAEKR
jgi:hypothetical protein